jgi:Na+/phosphate symporter
LLPDMYKPYNKPEKISKMVTENFSTTIEQTWNAIKPKPNQFLKIGEYICLKNLSETIENISVSARDKKIKDEKSNNSSEQLELDQALKIAKIEKDLTDGIIKKIKKELDEANRKSMEQKEKIAYIEHRTSILGNERQQKKIKKDFENKYRKFFEILNPDLKDLDSAFKLEIKENLIILSGVINDTLNDLDK